MNLQETGIWQGLRPPLLAGLLAGALLFVLPLLWVSQPAEGEDTQVLPASPVPAVDSPQPSAAPTGERTAPTPCGYCWRTGRWKSRPWRTICGR